MTLIAALLRPVGKWLMAGLAILAAVGALYYGGKRAGRAVEVEAGMRRQLDNVETRHAVEEYVARADDVERRRLRDKWTRR